MRQLFPLNVNNVDVEDLYLSADRTHDLDRPWVVVGMIESVDGAATTEGLSGGLGGAGDKRIFRALRSIPDVILVAGGTARAESYGPVRLSEEVQAARRARGQEGLPRLAIVSGSLDLDWASPLFAESSPGPLILTAADAEESALQRARDHAEVVAVGRGRADLAAGLHELGRRGAGVVLSEGGPSLNGAMLAGDLIDELALSLAPALVGGDGIRIFRGDAPPAPKSLDLAHALVDEGYLFLRYVRRSTT